MTVSMKKGALPPDPRVVIPKLEDYMYMVTTGLADITGKVHKLARYFAIGGYTNLELLKQVANTFGGVYLGVAVSDGADQQFSAGQPWTLPRPPPTSAPTASTTASCSSTAPSA
jgi:hypothetical protein